MWSFLKDYGNKRPLSRAAIVNRALTVHGPDVRNAQGRLSQPFSQTTIVPEAAEPLISRCNARPFERGLNSKGVKPKSPRGPDLVVCPASKVNAAPRGEHKKGWVCSSLRGTSPRPTPTDGWSHSAGAMKQNLPALNRSSVMDPPSQGGRWDAPCLFTRAIWFPVPLLFPQPHKPQ